MLNQPAQIKYPYRFRYRAPKCLSMNHENSWANVLHGRVDESINHTGYTNHEAINHGSRGVALRFARRTPSMHIFASTPREITRRFTRWDRNFSGRSKFIARSRGGELRAGVSASEPKRNVRAGYRTRLSSLLNRSIYPERIDVRGLKLVTASSQTLREGLRFQSEKWAAGMQVFLA